MHILLFPAILFSFALQAADTSAPQKFYFWSLLSASDPYWNTPQEGCAYLYSGPYTHLIDAYYPQENFFLSDEQFVCATHQFGSTYPSGQWGFGIIYRDSATCANGTIFDPSSKSCKAPSAQGTPLSKSIKLCSNQISPMRGDPINVLNGNLTESFDVFQNSDFYLFYNSSDGKWRTSYSESLQLNTDTATLTQDDGYKILFYRSGSVFTSPSGKGTITQDDHGATYISPDNEKHFFSTDGTLNKIKKTNGKMLQIRYNWNENTLITTITGNGQPDISILHNINLSPKSITTGNTTAVLQYDATNNLESVSNISSLSETTTTRFQYNDSLHPKSLTTLIDRRGTTYETWGYDTAGRAIYSQNSGNAGRTQITYGANSTQVTNELNKITEINFQTINGEERITSINGEPSLNCPASDSLYTYDNNGQITAKQDAQGYITTYTYNDRGLETSRTEASGTPLARITTTEWDPVRFLPTKVVTPTQTTLYTYDDQGRQLSQQTTMTSTN